MLWQHTNNSDGWMDGWISDDNNKDNNNNDNNDNNDNDQEPFSPHDVQQR
jgi:hypothetical protein